MLTNFNYLGTQPIFESHTQINQNMRVESDSDDTDILPLFCVRTTERTTGQTLYLNFKSSDAIQEPKVEFDEEKIAREFANQSPSIQRYKVPLKLSQIFWSKAENNEKKQRAYVVDVEINDRFAIRRVIPSEVVRHFVILVTMDSIEEKFNPTGATKLIRQYIGHKLDLDPNDYEILDTKQRIERSNELVNNKILLVENLSSSEPVKEILPTSDNSNDLTETSYDLFLRPKSMLLTCSIQTDTCPDSISFNDDRVRVELGDRILLDVYLSLNIDLDEPAKYKFDERQGLFRIVFKLKE